jgi:hypothetical protein
MEPLTLNILRIDNGYILRGPLGEDISVIEDVASDELHSHEVLLWEVMDHFNFAGSKHDKERLRIVRESQEE